MSTKVHYSAAERASFELVPETCPELDRAFEKAFETPDFDSDFAKEIFAKYNLATQPDKQLYNAMGELIGRTLFARKAALQKVVLYEGTFPLRHALVQQLAETRGLENGRDNYGYWLSHYKQP